jgi:xylulokinase
MDRIAARVPAGSNGVVYTPWIFGERSPVEDSEVRASIFNLSLENSREDIIRAFLEGVAFNTRWMLAPAEKFLGRKIESLNLVGGGAKSAVWCQVFADVMNLTIRQLKDPIEVNARGAAFIAAEALGLIKFEDLHQYVEVETVYTPNPANRAIYDKVFAEFVTYYQQTKGIYKRLNKK